MQGYNREFIYESREKSVRKRELLFKFDLLRQRYKDYIKMDLVKIPEFTMYSELEIMEREYTNIKSEIKMMIIGTQVMQVIDQNENIKNVVGKITEHVLSEAAKMYIEGIRISTEEENRKTEKEREQDRKERKRNFINFLPIPSKIARSTKTRYTLYMAARCGDFDTWFENRPKRGMMAFSFDKEAYKMAYRHDQPEFLEKLIALNPSITRIEERCKRKHGEKGDLLRGIPRDNKIN